MILIKILVYLLMPILPARILESLEDWEGQGTDGTSFQFIVWLYRMPIANLAESLGRRLTAIFRRLARATDRHCDGGVCSLSTSRFDCDSSSLFQKASNIEIIGVAFKCHLPSFASIYIQVDLNQTCMSRLGVDMWLEVSK